MSMTARQLRQLVQIESELELSQPRLTAMFDMFAELTSGERANGVEQLPGRRRRWASAVGALRRVPRPHEILALVMLVAAITLGVFFAGRSHPAPRQCQAVSGQAQVKSLPVPVWPLVPANPSCPRYITSR